MKKAIAGCTVLLVVIFFVRVESRGSTFLNENDIDVTFRTYQMVRDAGAMAAGIYSSRTEETSPLEADLWARTMFGYCGPEEDLVPDNYVFKNMKYKYTDYEFVNKLIETYRMNREQKERSDYLTDRIDTYSSSCHAERGITSLRFSIKNYIKDSTLLFGQRESTVIKFYCLYDTSIDSMIFVDSLHVNTPDDKASFRGSAFDAQGENFYFKKRGVVVRFNIDSRVLDSIVHGDMPLIPHNSDDIIVYDNKSATIKLLASDETVRSSVDAVVTKPLTVCKVQDDVFLVGQTVSRRTHYRPRMEVLLVDFKNNEVTELFETDQGQIFDVKVYPKDE